jgi:hypothetical protein
MCRHERGFEGHRCLTVRLFVLIVIRFSAVPSQLTLTGQIAFPDPDSARSCGFRACRGQSGIGQSGSHSSKHAVTPSARMMLGWQNSSYSVSNSQFVQPSGIGSEDSVEGGGMDAEGSGDPRNGFSFLDEPGGEVSLLLVNLFGPTETISASLCSCATGSSALRIKSRSNSLSPRK